MWLSYEKDIEKLDCMLLSCHVHISEGIFARTESSLNIKELIAATRRDIWNLSDSNGIWSHNYLVRKQTLNQLVDCSFTN